MLFSLSLGLLYCHRSQRPQNMQSWPRSWIYPFEQPQYAQGVRIIRISCTGASSGCNSKLRPVTEGVKPFIASILGSDRQAPRKQRHTAHRIWQRLRRELPELPVAESTIRKYVRERKRELGWSTRVTCVPQSYAPGQKGQADWVGMRRGRS
jgi:hypothetical protein